MDNYTSLLPGRNPGGSPVYSPVEMPNVGSSSGTNPMIPQMPNLGVGATGTNVFDPSSVVPTFGANTGSGYSPTSLVPGTSGGTPRVPGSSPVPGGAVPGSKAVTSGTGLANMSPQDQKSMLNELSKTYGHGTATAIMQFLQGGAGFNQQSVNNILAALGPGYERAQQNLIEQFSTGGNRFGSGAQIGLADLMSQEQLNMGAIESQMYQQSIQDYLGTLMGAGQTSAKRIASSPGAFDWISMILGAAQSGASDYIAAGAGG